MTRKRPDSDTARAAANSTIYAALSRRVRGDDRSSELPSFAQFVIRYFAPK